jgi:hypothetical protein
MAMNRRRQAQDALEVTAEQLDSYVVGEPTSDDVSFTYDGRRLDTREKVLAFLAEIDGEGASPPRGG